MPRFNSYVIRTILIYAKHSTFMHIITTLESDVMSDIEVISNTNLKSARLMITDICPYSCQWCAVNSYKQNTIEDGLKLNFGGNEGALVRDPKVTSADYLTSDDYGFLSETLGLFGVNDFTLTGGDPFIRKDIGTIASSIKEANPKAKITALTKGAPLFGKSPLEIRDVAGPIDRIIFSLDTMDPKMHAKLNLPLTDSSIALEFLGRTLDVIQNTVNAGYIVEINTVVPPFTDKSDLEYIREILRFITTLQIDRIKLIELDSADVQPGYIEGIMEYLDLGGEYMLLESTLVDLSGRHNTVVATIDRSEYSEDSPLAISVQRVDCSVSRIEGQMACNFEKMGELLINTTGQANACRHIPNKNIDIRDAILARDPGELISRLCTLRQTLAEQNCPMLGNAI